MPKGRRYTDEQLLKVLKKLVSGTINNEQAAQMLGLKQASTVMNNRLRELCRGQKVTPHLKVTVAKAKKQETRYYLELIDQALNGTSVAPTPKQQAVSDSPQDYPFSVQIEAHPNLKPDAVNSQRGSLWAGFVIGAIAGLAAAVSSMAVATSLLG